MEERYRLIYLKVENGVVPGYDSRVNESRNQSQRADPSILIYHNNVKLFISIEKPLLSHRWNSRGLKITVVYWQQASDCAQQSPIGQHALAAKADAPNKITMVIRLTTGKEKRDFMINTPD